MEKSGEEDSPDGGLSLGVLQEASIMGHDLVLWEVQVELQGHQNGELKGDQLTSVHPKPLLQFINENLDFVFLQVSADLGRQQDAGSGAEFSVLFVEFTLQHQLLEVNESHGYRGLLVSTFPLS